jgi:hypothetical protein
VKKLHVLFVVNFLLCFSFFANGQKGKVVYSDSSFSKMIVTNSDSTDKEAISFSIMDSKYSIEYLTINGESACFAVKKIPN